MLSLELSIAIAGVGISLVGIYLKIIYSQPSRGSHEYHLRERLAGKGDEDGFRMRLTVN